jgi:hypothetical protein
MATVAPSSRNHLLPPPFGVVQELQTVRFEDGFWVTAKA